MTAGLKLASQLGPLFDERLRRRMPGLEVLSIAAGVPTHLNDDVGAMIAMPFRQSGQPAPAMPAGWPFGLNWIQLITVGTDLYPDWLFTGPKVSCARGTTSVALAEFALAAIFAAAKDMPGIWIDDAKDWTDRRVAMVRGATLGLVGFGGIGSALAPRALALGMNVIAIRRTDAPLGVAGVERVGSIGEVFQRSDHVVVAAPATAGTRHLISAEVLARAKPGLHLVNLARGVLIDDEALIAALDGGQVGLASLDVTHPEPLPAGHRFYTHPQVRLSPHVAAMTPDIAAALLDKVVDNLGRIGRGDPPTDVVDIRRGY